MYEERGRKWDGNLGRMCGNVIRSRCPVQTEKMPVISTVQSGNSPRALLTTGVGVGIVLKRILGLSRILVLVLKE